MNEMDENKLPFGNILKLIAQKYFFQKEPCSQGSKGLSCPKKQSCFGRKKRFKLVLGEQPCS